MEEEGLVENEHLPPMVGGTLRLHPDDQPNTMGGTSSVKFHSRVVPLVFHSTLLTSAVPVVDGVRRPLLDGREVLDAQLQDVYLAAADEAVSIPVLETSQLSRQQCHFRKDFIAEFQKTFALRQREEDQVT